MEDNEQAASSAAPSPADQSAPPTPAPEAIDPPAGQTPAPDDDDDDEGADGTDTPETAASKSAARRERRRQQREAERAELAFYRQQAATRPATPLSLEDRIGPPPDPRNFRDQATFAAELAAYNVQKRGAASAMAAEKRQSEDIQNRSVQAREARAAVLEAAFMEKTPDYNQAMQAIQYVSVPQTALDAIAESDLRPQILYHLGKNPQKAAALNQMTPLQAAKEIGRIEAQLSASPAPRTTQAPPPPSALKGGSAGPTKTLADLAARDNVAEYAERRKAELNAARR